MESTNFCIIIGISHVETEKTMIKRKFMRTRQLVPGMKIDQAIEDRMGRHLVTKGTVVYEYIID